MQKNDAEWSIIEDANKWTIREEKTQTSGLLLQTRHKHNGLLHKKTQSGVLQKKRQKQSGQ